MFVLFRSVLFCFVLVGTGLKEHFYSAHMVSELIYMTPSNLREYRIDSLEEIGNGGKRYVEGGEAN